jgi:hypothetical protein
MTTRQLTAKFEYHQDMADQARLGEGPVAEADAIIEDTRAELALEYALRADEGSGRSC